MTRHKVNKDKKRTIVGASAVDPAAKNPRGSWCILEGFFPHLCPDRDLAEAANDERPPPSVVELTESLGKAVTLSDERVFAESHSLKTDAGQDFGECQVFLIEVRVAPVRFMVCSEKTREDRCVRGHRPGCGGVCAEKQQAFACDPIDIGSRGFVVSVAGEMIGPHRV